MKCLNLLTTLPRGKDVNSTDKSTFTDVYAGNGDMTRKTLALHNQTVSRGTGQKMVQAGHVLRLLQDLTSQFGKWMLLPGVMDKGIVGTALSAETVRMWPAMSVVC